MEQLLFRVHVRLLTVSNRILTPVGRRALEWTVLLAAVAVITTLTILHLTFVLNSTNPSMNCILAAMDKYERHSLSSYVLDPGEGIGTGGGTEVQWNSTAHRDALRQRMRDKFDIIALTIEPKKNQKLSLFDSLRQWRDVDSSASQQCSLGATCESSGSAYATALDKSSSAWLKPTAETDTSIDIDAGIRISSLTTSPKDYTKRRANSYLFSYSRGSLMLAQETTSHHYNFSTIHLSFSTDLECFGSPSSSFLARHVTGYDVIVMNWAISAFSGSGFLYNLKSKELFNLNYASNFVAKKGVNIAEMGRRESYRTSSVVSEWLAVTRNTVVAPMIVVVEERVRGVQALIREYFLAAVSGDDEHQSTLNGGPPSQSWANKLRDVSQFIAFRLGVLFSTTFVFFVSSSLVSYVLRETQERMLKFTFLLQYHISRNLPYTSLVATHLTASLIFVPIIMGIYFFMFEFFADQLLAFLVLLVVWMGEVFSILSLRSKESIKYFPSVFCCYFYLFHVYFFNYPFGFCYLALLGATLLELHAMMHFVNVFEIPAFLSGRLSVMRPRLMNVVTVASPVTATLPNNGGLMAQGVSTSQRSTGSVSGGTPARAGPESRSRSSSTTGASAGSAQHGAPSAAHPTVPPPPMDPSPSSSAMSSGALGGLFPDLLESSNNLAGLNRPRAQSLNSKPDAQQRTSPRGTTKKVPIVLNIHETIEERRARLAMRNTAEKNTVDGSAESSATTGQVSNSNTSEQSTKQSLFSSQPMTLPLASLILPSASEKTQHRERSNSDGMVSNWQDYLHSSKNRQGSSAVEIEDDYGLVDVDADMEDPLGLSPEVSVSGKHVVRNGSSNFESSSSKKHTVPIPPPPPPHARPTAGAIRRPIRPTEASPREEKRFTIFGSFEEMY